MQIHIPPPIRGLVLAVVLIFAARFSSAAPIALNTPAGLNPGDPFRFLFVTAGLTTATMSDLGSYYNSWVQGQAGGATYGGVTVNWKAVGSTVLTSAAFNVGGFGTNVPVYLVDGTRLARSMGRTYGEGLWGGSLEANPSLGIDGSVVSGLAWTGSDTQGLTVPERALGWGTTIYGTTTQRDGSWISYQWYLDKSSFLHMYGLSEELNASSPPVPEIDPAGMGAVLAVVTGALGLRERRRLKVA